ncbi:hypothetical protein [Shimazuella kribbensis]|uniref:hypothetical protein n=1 Tax=Shimazuella kribbensis TaxID=139808 RepID=UPI00040668FB|nr:hypothetical protein [Shimazuella kribbensis]
MKKQYKYGLLLTLLISIFSLTTGCFGGLNDAQKTSATYFNTLFAKSEKPSAEERYQKLISVVSSTVEGGPATPENKDEIMENILKMMVNGITKTYYIADNPKEPQSDTRRSVIVRFPKGTFNEANNALGGDSGQEEDAYITIILNKEGEEWKIIDIQDDDTESILQQKIDWLEVEPTDYLD